MTNTVTTNNTLISALWPKTDTNRILRLIALAVVATILLTISAKLKVPFWPVPMTMQPFAVMMIGMVFGWRLGVATLTLYLAQGALGLPVFSGTPERGIGLAYMMGPTGGYLVGFVLSAALVGFLAERGWGRDVVSTGAAMFLGTAVIYAMGIMWLSAFTGGLDKAFAVGVAPFLLGDALKIVLAALLVPGVWKLVQRIRS
ncbi:MAG: biotin transporter BioY [Rhodospirillales bacterium]|nr:biotin transporter BioY [Rhodospirillales bacterium]MCW8952517.1 biotin transporter BioY [Rhodospirillales bacterium]MCW8970031.1 biotin transporter BioY [Rhodospirillales bacterium]MCW9003005.1 biotin transporter BioY [Rhodospirillales bacterium]